MSVGRGLGALTTGPRSYVAPRPKIPFASRTIAVAACYTVFAAARCYENCLRATDYEQATILIRPFALWIQLAR